MILTPKELEGIKERLERARMCVESGQFPTFLTLRPEDIELLLKHLETQESEEQQFLNFMNKLGIVFKEFRDPEFLDSYEIVKQDVAYSLGRHGEMDFNFKNGQFVGTNTSGRMSYEPRKESLK